MVRRSTAQRIHGLFEVLDLMRFKDATVPELDSLLTRPRTKGILYREVHTLEDLGWIRQAYRRRLDNLHWADVWKITPAGKLMLEAFGQAHEYLMDKQEWDVVSGV